MSDPAMPLILELDTDEPTPYTLTPVRTARFAGRADLVVCRCNPILIFAAATLRRERGIAATLVGICSRVAVGAVMSGADAPHPVNVIAIDSADPDAELTTDNAMFAAIGLVRRA